MSSAERALLLKTTPLVIGVRLGLWLLPSRLVMSRIQRLQVRYGRPPGPPSRPVGRIVWAVRAVSRHVPHATCLTQALAAQMALWRHGHASTLRIGVGRDKHQRIVAHAWVEVGGEVVIGGDELHQYTQFPELTPAASSGTCGLVPPGC